MKRVNKILLLSAIAVIGLVTLAGIVLAQSSRRPDCPGKITCPLTGQEVCRDKCPTVDPNRQDCPGRIVCPLTGELVCRDRCPLGNGVAADKAATSKLPPCCAKKD